MTRYSGLPARGPIKDAGIDAVRDCAAVERGPLVMCAESADSPARFTSTLARRSVDVPLISYHRWATRGPSTMRVWLPVCRQCDVGHSFAGARKPAMAS
jgi:DUF1680 family protein